ncbi:MAG: hemolysin family protein [Ruminococcus sp.]|nr:hemolysin family protein [Ruminococcus sp.]MDD6448085.1 hemolysin family protein [Ruminococcus sp.]MDY2856102.1 hemolysin family protein [Oscillospiraceae bacterium]
MLQQLLLQLILILLNAFFAATEIAVISLNEKKVRALADEGDKKAKKMLKIITEPTRFLSTIQIGITLAGFLGSAFAADNFAQGLSDFIIKAFNVSPEFSGAINTVAVIVITLILSYFTLVLGELVPKRIAMKHKEKLANSVCGIISFLAAVLRPIIWFLTISTNAVLKIFGINPKEKEEPVSEEDIVLLLDAGADEGSFKADDIEYIKNVFKLENKTAEDVMTSRKSIVFLSLGSSQKEIAHVIKNNGYSRIPVFDGDVDNIVGILHIKDYLMNSLDNDFKLKDILRKPVFVPESVSLSVLFKEMQTNHTHMSVVINEYGETAGIVTMEDILEELVGEIWDESDSEVTEFQKINDTQYKVSCNTTVDGFMDYFNLDSDSSIEAATVNGWLAEISGTIPQVGYTLEYKNLVITVTKADDVMAHEIFVEIK